MFLWYKFEQFMFLFMGSKLAHKIFQAKDLKEVLKYLNPFEILSTDTFYNIDFLFWSLMETFLSKIFSVRDIFTFLMSFEQKPLKAMCSLLFDQEKLEHAMLNTTVAL